MMEIPTMLTNAAETMREAPAESEMSANGPVIVSPGAPEAFIQANATPNGAVAAPETDCPGVEGEETVWEGHYSAKNFIGRTVIGSLLILVWLYVAFRTWGVSSQISSVWALGLGIGVVFYWLNLGYRYLRAHRGHHYRLTTRRLFVTTGFFSRRVDQIELLRIKDVYIQQSMIGDWLGIGNVVLISSEHTLPKAYLLGVENPRGLMDLLWHHMRLEQTQKTHEVRQV
jgi:hypothetical protein